MKGVSFIIWHGRHESQGLALQEALASNIPMLVIDMNKIEDWDSELRSIKLYKSKNLHYTSVPYFDERCGIIIYQISELDNAIEQMLNRFITFHPRAFIIENLNLEKQVRKLLRLFNIIESSKESIPVKTKPSQKNEDEIIYRIIISGKHIYML